MASIFSPVSLYRGLKKPSLRRRLLSRLRKMFVLPTQQVGPDGTAERHCQEAHRDFWVTGINLPWSFALCYPKIKPSISLSNQRFPQYFGESLSFKPWSQFQGLPESTSRWSDIASGCIISAVALSSPVSSMSINVYTRPPAKNQRWQKPNWTVVDNNSRKD